MLLDLWWACQRGREDIDDQAFGRAPTAHNLAAVMDGDLFDLTNSLQKEEMVERLAEATGPKV